MKRAGQIAVTAFPYADDPAGAKFRPVLILRQASHRYDDWLVCMVSSRLQQAEVGFDEIVDVGDPDFVTSGLKAASVFRLKRLAVLGGGVLLGSIGAVNDVRLSRMRRRLADWICGDHEEKPPTEIS